MTPPTNAEASFGVIVPAFHGAASLPRSLCSLARQSFDGPLHVVVAVNDGREDTWQSAQSLSAGLAKDRVRCDVIRTAQGRIAAFRAAEELLQAGPRLYLDQDAELSVGVIDSLAAHLAPGTGWHFAVPLLRLTADCGHVAHAYFRGWMELPYVRTSPVTIGAYAVSRAGRARWGAFPAVHSDDKFVRSRFAPAERVVLSDESYSVCLPAGWRDLVRARRRYARGNRELAALGLADDAGRYDGLVRTVVTHPRHWADFAIVAAVHLAAALDRPGRGLKAMTRGAR